jgi:heme exporter protein B
MASNITQLTGLALPARKSGFLRQSLAIAGKDLRSELRTKETLNASVSFSLVILLLFSFAFDPSVEEIREISGGLLWLVFAFASALVLNRSFARELVNDCLDTLLSSPTSGPELYFGKCLSNYVLLLLVEAICIPVFGIFYNVRWSNEWPALIGVMLLGTWGLTAIGTMFSAMTVNLRLRELMLPILVYPMMIPALVGAIHLTTVLMAGQPLGENLIWFRLLIVFDVIFTLLSFAMVEIVLVG